jgi:hypothetical protein
MLTANPMALRPIAAVAEREHQDDPEQYLLRENNFGQLDSPSSSSSSCVEA